MEIEKVIIKKLSFAPKEIYSALLLENELIMNKLRNLFEGKCANKSYISKIIEIQKIGDIIINNSETEGNCTIDVMFRCYTITLDEGYIIIDAKKLKSENENIIYTTPYAIIYCRKTEYPFLYEDNAILYVNKSSYDNGKSYISTYASIFINKRIEYKYNILFNGFKDLEIKETKKLFDKYKEVYEKYIKHKNNKYVKLFTELFYPYNTNHEHITLKQNKHITVNEFIENMYVDKTTDYKNKLLTFSPLLSLHSDKILIKNENDKPDNNLYVSKKLTIDSKYFCDIMLIGKITMLQIILRIEELCNLDIKYYNNLQKQITHYNNIKI